MLSYTVAGRHNLMLSCIQRRGDGVHTSSMLLVMAIGIVGTCSSTVPCWSTLLLVTTVALLLVVRYVTVRYRVSDVSLHSTTGGLLVV